MFTELLADFITDMFDNLSDDEINQMGEAIGKKTAKEVVLNAYLKQKGLPFLDKLPFVKQWTEKCHIGELRELSMRAITKELQRIGVRPGMIKRARFDLNATTNYTWYRKQNKSHPYAWRYLISEKHSDRCIYRMRRHWKNKDKTSNIDIQFNGPKSKVYLYHKIPNVIILVMCLIPLTYLTKNNYFAGAWNFFWYAWQGERDEHRKIDLYGFRFMNSKRKKGILKYMNEIIKGEK